MADIIRPEFVSKRDRDLDEWSDYQTAHSIKKMRMLLGMPPVVEKATECKRCDRTFRTTFVGGRRQQWFCGHCRVVIADMEDWY